MRISLLDDIPLPPKAKGIAPPPPEEYVTRSEVFGQSLPMIEAEQRYIVYAPSTLEDMLDRSPLAVRSLASRTWTHLFLDTRTRPFHDVITSLKANPEFDALLQGKVSEKEAVERLGFLVIKPESISLEGITSLKRTASVHLAGEDVAVAVEANKGPIADGVSELMGYCGDGEGHRYGAGGKTWANMTATEREVWLVMVAKHKQKKEYDTSEQKRQVTTEEKRQREFWKKENQQKCNSLPTRKGHSRDGGSDWPTGTPAHPAPVERTPLPWLGAYR